MGLVFQLYLRVDKNVKGRTVNTTMASDSYKARHTVCTCVIIIMHTV